MTIDLHFLLLLIVGGLAAGRFATLVSQDGITEPIRHWIWQWSPPKEEPGEEVYTLQPVGEIDGNQAWIQREPGFVGQLVDCHHCVGVWASAGLIVGYLLLREPTLWAATLLALAQTSDITVKAAR